MSGNNQLVPPLSWAAIEDLTNSVRAALKLSDEPHFPVMTVLERILDHKLELLSLEVGSRDEMGDAEGFTCPEGSFIRLRDDVYRKAWEGNGRARFTAAHELGHYVLHAGAPLARVKQSERYPPYRLSEPQANVFAASILMPRRFFTEAEDASTVANRHGVSREAANNRLKYLRRK